MDKKYEAIRIQPHYLISFFEKNFDNNLKYSIKKIKVNDILPTSIYVKNSRLEYAKFTAKKLREQNIDLYEPHIKYDGNLYRLVPPPIVESRKEGLVLCDGTHRVMVAKELDIKEIIILYVENAYKPLAGQVTSWSKIIRTDKSYKTEDNFLNFCQEGMTGYSKFCNSEIMNSIKIFK